MRFRLVLFLDLLLIIAGSSETFHYITHYAGIIPRMYRHEITGALVIRPHASCGGDRCLRHVPIILSEDIARLPRL